MNIFDYAIELEKEGETLYRKFAKTAQDKGLANIFSWLAEQEKRHYGVFEAMKGGGEVSLADTSFLKDVKSVFADWKSNADNVKRDISQSNLYRKALVIEQKSYDFYMEKSREIRNETQKDMFQRIAKEERRHYEILEHIIEFITQPERWVENAEFSHIGEQY